MAVPLGAKRISANSGCALDGVDDGDAAQLAARACRLPPRGEAGHVGQLERGLHVGAELAAVVRHAERRLVGHGARGNDVAPAQLDRVGAELAGRVVDEPLDDVGRLRPAGAAIGGGRVGVAQHAEHLHVGGGDRVDADQRDDVAEGGQQIAVGRHVGADVGQRRHAQRQELAVGIQRQLGVGHVVARVLVGGNRLAPLAPPLHGAAELARGPQDEAMLGILPALGAEGAADVAHDHADGVLRHLEDVGGQRVAHAVGILHVGVERVAPLAGIPRAERAARLHVLRVDARDDVAPLDHARRRSEGCLGGDGVACLVEVRDVVGALVPDRGPAGGGRRGGRHRGQRRVVDHQALGGVLGLSQRLGHDHGDGIAHVARAPARQGLVRRREHRRAVGALALERHLHRAEVVAEVVTGEDGEDAGDLERGLRVDAGDARVGVQRADDDRVGLAQQVHVVVEAALALDEADVLEPLDALTNPELAHQGTSTILP